MDRALAGEVIIRDLIDATCFIERAEAYALEPSLRITINIKSAKRIIYFLPFTVSMSVQIKGTSYEIGERVVGRHPGSGLYFLEIEGKESLSFSYPIGFTQVGIINKKWEETGKGDLFFRISVCMTALIDNVYRLLGMNFEWIRVPESDWIAWLRAWDEGIKPIYVSERVYREFVELKQQLKAARTDEEMLEELIRFMKEHYSKKSNNL